MPPVPRAHMSRKVGKNFSTRELNTTPAPAEHSVARECAAWRCPCADLPDESFVKVSLQRSSQFQFFPTDRDGSGRRRCRCCLQCVFALAKCAALRCVAFIVAPMKAALFHAAQTCASSQLRTQRLDVSRQLLMILVALARLTKVAGVAPFPGALVLNRKHSSVKPTIACCRRIIKGAWLSYEPNCLMAAS